MVGRTYSWLTLLARLHPLSLYSVATVLLKSERLSFPRRRIRRISPQSSTGLVGSQRCPVQSWLAVSEVLYELAGRQWTCIVLWRAGWYSTLSCTALANSQRSPVLGWLAVIAVLYTACYERNQWKNIMRHPSMTERMVEQEILR